jgi:hypothetical protein
MTSIIALDAHVWSRVRLALYQPRYCLELVIGPTTLRSKALHDDQSIFQIAAILYEFTEEVSYALISMSSYSPALWYVNGAALILRLSLHPTITLDLEVHHLLQHISLAIRLSTVPGRRVLLFSRNSWISPREEELLTEIRTTLFSRGHETTWRPLNLDVEITANPPRYAADLSKLPCCARMLSCGWIPMHRAALMPVWHGERKEECVKLAP